MREPSVPSDAWRCEVPKALVPHRIRRPHCTSSPRSKVTQALITLNLAREAGIERFVYLSVIHTDKFTNVRHFTGKHTVERMIDSLDIPATILRPAYFMQNDRMVQQTIQDYSVYPMPIGSAGVSMIECA